MSIHVLNRGLVILLSILAVIFWAGFVFSIWAYPRLLGSTLRQLGTALAADPIFQTMMSLLGIAIILIASLVLLSEFMPDGGSVVRLPQVTGGRAVISIESLAQLAKHEAEQVPLVIHARPRVLSLGDKVDVILELRTEPVAHVPSAVEETCRVIRSAFEDRTGVPIRHLDVQLRNESHVMPGQGQGQGSTTGRFETDKVTQIITVGGGASAATAVAGAGRETVTEHHAGEGGVQV